MKLLIGFRKWKTDRQGFRSCAILGVLLVTYGVFALVVSGLLGGLNHETFPEIIFLFGLLTICLAPVGMVIGFLGLLAHIGKYKEYFPTISLIGMVGNGAFFGCGIYLNVA
jgi:hypothetical protein